MSSILTYLKEITSLTVGVIVYCFLNLIHNIRLYLFPIYKSLSDDVVLITGAGNGLGRSLCVEFSKYCPTILALDVDENGLKETAELVLTSTGCLIKTYKCDLKNEQAIDETIQLILNDFNKVTVLVNNAGIAKVEEFLQSSREDFEDVLKVNTLAQYQLTKAFLPFMLGKVYNSQSLTDPQGHIVCLASISGVMCFRRFHMYGASKSAILLLMESLEQELDSIGITDQICITRVLPFLINTNMICGVSGTRSAVLPVIDTVSCAKRIVDGVLKNERVIYIPSCLRLFGILKL
ncbi:unnamed protein product [Heterobilharzia americana]|nr:unnamed protein product [Heterobilharzia americana]